MQGVTDSLVRIAREIKPAGLPPEVETVAKQCVLDWLGVAIAGSREPLSRILAAEAAEHGGAPRASLVGRGERTSVAWAALVNGAAGHALDFDDTHLAMMGHPTAPVLPAALAVAEARERSGAELLAAFVAGVETECRLGAVVGAGHYAAGWHATSTLGTFGAAAACAHLAGLDETAWRHAFGLAGSQASGAKGAFGTMAKPFHAGRAAMAGVIAAGLAERGFTADDDVVEGAQGFAATQTPTFDPDAIDRLDGRFTILDTVFKYHAACYLTHASIEAALRLDVRPSDVEAVRVVVPPGHLEVCAIPEPSTGLEGKFSLRATVAMALLGLGTGEDAFTDELMGRSDLVRMRDAVEVVTSTELRAAESRVVVRLKDGSTAEATVDVGVPDRDLERQGARLRAKFLGLATPVLGAGRAAAICDEVERLHDPRRLLELCRP